MWASRMGFVVLDVGKYSISWSWMDWKLMRQEGDKVSFLTGLGADQRFFRMLIMLLINDHGKSPWSSLSVSIAPQHGTGGVTRRAGGRQAGASPYLHVPS